MWLRTRAKGSEHYFRIHELNMHPPSCGLRELVAKFTPGFEYFQYKSSCPGNPLSTYIKVELSAVYRFPPNNHVAHDRLQLGKPPPPGLVVRYSINRAAVEAPTKAVMDKYSLNLAAAFMARSTPPGNAVHLKEMHQPEIESSQQIGLTASAQLHISHGTRRLFGQLLH